MLNDFPIDIFKEREDDYQVIYEYLESLQSTKADHEEVIDPATELKQTSANKIIAVFLQEMSRHIRREFYQELVFFALMYRRALNLFGWTTKANLTGRAEGDESGEYCELNNGELMPEICNEFINCYLIEFMQDYDISKFKVIGPTLDQLRNAVFLTQHFCNWLNYHKYTLARLVLNPEDN